MNFLVLFIFSYLAVSINAAVGYESTTDVTTEASTEANTQANDSQNVTEEAIKQTTPNQENDTSSDKNPAEIEAETQQTKYSNKYGNKHINKHNAEPVLTGSTAKWNGSFMIPFPLNIIWTTVGKDILKSVDVESMCDAVQMVDWKNYQKLLENEDFVGFQKKISNDEILTLVAESLQQSTINYLNKMATAVSNSMKIDGFESLQNNMKQIFGKFNAGTPKDSSSVNVLNDTNAFLEPLTVYNTVQKEALNNLQINLNRLMDLLSKAKAQSSVAVSTKTDFSGQDLL